MQSLNNITVPPVHAALCVAKPFLIQAIVMRTFSIFANELCGSLKSLYTFVQA
jgi:hypothetical protein